MLTTLVNKTSHEKFLLFNSVSNWPNDSGSSFNYDPFPMYILLIEYGEYRPACVREISVYNADGNNSMLTWLYTQTYTPEHRK